MFRIHALPFTCALALGLTLVGCGDSDDSDSDSADRQPPAEAVVQSATAYQAMEQASQAVTAALAEQQNANVAYLPRARGHGGALATMWPLMLGQQLQATSHQGFKFDSSVEDLVVDLDVDDGSGGDRYPNATGSLLVDASGSGNTDAYLAEGQVSYTITLEVQDDIVVTDPHAGTVVTWAQGDTASWTISYEWKWVDDQNWNYVATLSHQEEQLVFTVTTAEGQDFQATVDAETEAQSSLNVSNGNWGGSFTLTGIRNTVWVAPSGRIYTVLWDMRSLDEIHLTVNGRHYGPYTLGEIIYLFHVGLNTQHG